MRCLVSAGPTYEPLDAVRRMTNLSTGRLGCELATFLAEHGHEVTLLLGEQATHAGGSKAQQIQRFTTTAHLAGLLEGLSTSGIGAIFHAAAVSDFSFGNVWVRSDQGSLTEVKSSKISTREGALLAELVPTPKIILRLAEWFPEARIVGWKFETEGDRTRVIEQAKKQIAECASHACVANGPAYGAGFGIVNGKGEVAHVEERTALFAVLEALVRV